MRTKNTSVPPLKGGAVIHRSAKLRPVCLLCCSCRWFIWVWVCVCVCERERERERERGEGEGGGLNVEYNFNKNRRIIATYLKGTGSFRLLQHHFFSSSSFFVPSVQVTSVLRLTQRNRNIRNNNNKTNKQKILMFQEMVESQA